MTALTSKSKEIRRYSYEFINLNLVCWETHHLEKHVNSIQNSIHKVIGDNYKKYNIPQTSSSYLQPPTPPNQQNIIEKPMNNLQNLTTTPYYDPPNSTINDINVNKVIIIEKEILLI